MPCKFILTRGKNKDLPCGKSKNDYCSKHISHKPIELPMNIFTVIIHHLVFQDHLDYKSIFKNMLNIYPTCKDFKFIVDKQWELLYNLMMHPQDKYMSMLSYKQRLHLLLESGCQRCGIPRIKKIHWPFPIRVCEECIKEVCISEYKLKKEYNIVYKSDLFIEVNTWNQRTGNNKFKVYWKYLVEKKIGHSLLDTFMNIYKHNIAKTLDIPYKELLVRSVKYKNISQPGIKDVETQYYQSVANDTFDAFVKEKYDIELKPIENMKSEIKKITSKNLYNNWLNDYQDKYIEYCKQYEYDETQNKLFEQLRKLFTNIQYFQNVNWKSLEEAKLLLNRTYSSDTIVYLKRDVDICKIKFLEFIHHNLPLKDEIIKNDLEANQVFNNMMRYPNKTINDITGYVKKILEKKNLNLFKDMILPKIVTWNDVLDLIVKISQKSRCEICEDKLYNYHEYMSHLKRYHHNYIDISINFKTIFYEWLKKQVKLENYRPKNYDDLDAKLMNFIYKDDKELNIKFSNYKENEWFKFRANCLNLKSDITKNMIRIIKPDKWIFDATLVKSKKELNLSEDTNEEYCNHCNKKLTIDKAYYHYSGMGPLCMNCIDSKEELSYLKWETLDF